MQYALHQPHFPPYPLYLLKHAHTVWDAKIEGAKHHNYVELKTTEWLDENRLPPQQWQRKMLNYDRRKLKYWAQSYLIGCPTVIVGKKDTDGHIHMPLEVLKTNNIPAAVRNTSGAWNSVVCVQTLGAFLECETYLPSF